MAPSSSSVLASDEEDFQDANEADSSLLVDGQQQDDSAAMQQQSESAAVAQETGQGGKSNGYGKNGLSAAEGKGGKATEGGDGTVGDTTSGAGDSSSSPSPAKTAGLTPSGKGGKKGGKKATSTAAASLKEKKATKAALKAAAAASASPSGSPVLESASTLSQDDPNSAADATSTGPASPLRTTTSAEPDPTTRPPTPPAPGARVSQSFANAQPFSSSPSLPTAEKEEEGAAPSTDETAEVEMEAEASPRGTTVIPLPAASTALNTTLSRPFSLSSNPDTPSSPPPPSAAPLPSSSSTTNTTPQRQQQFTHKSVSSHSHSDPDQTQSSPSITGMAWRSHAATNSAGSSSGKGKGGVYDDDEDEEEGEFEDEDLGELGGKGTPSKRLNGRERAQSEVSASSSLGGRGTNGGAEIEGGAAEGGKYDFLRQRVESQTQDPAQHRASVQGMTSIRESFARVRERELEKRQQVVGEEIDWDFWGRVMSNYEEVASTHPRELSRAIQRGIPPALRGMVWQLMAATKDPTLEGVYSELLNQPSPHEKSIGRDLGRTFPGHEFFKEGGGRGQENLFNVVKAYSIYDEEVGYTQGLQFIVGPLLLNMPDEEAFCVLVRLMKSYDLRSHYTPNMPGLQLRLFQFDRLLEELLPGVFMHLLRQGIKSSMYASQWFLTLFGYRFPLELVSSVFDLVFAEGVEAIFRFSVAILKRSEEKICQLEFEDLIEFLKNELYEVYAPDPDDPSPNPQYKAQEFVREALQVKITPLMLDQFGEEWANLCAQQSAHSLEVDTLRKANAQLSLQVRQLEASLSQINIEHCDLVKQVVMAKLEREELEDELVKYKIAYADISHQQASDGASFSRSSMQSIQSTPERPEPRERQSTVSSMWSAMSRGNGSQGV